MGPGRAARSRANLSDCDAVVHLAGKNIVGHWTEEVQARVLRQPGARHCRPWRRRRPSAFARRVSHEYSFLRFRRSATTEIVAKKLLTEESSPGQGFLAEVCQQWEAATAVASEAGVRVVNLRTGVVLARDGGALKPMLLPFRLGLGGRIGSGQQYWSWISLDDEVGAMLFVLQNDSLRGPVNAVGPTPVRNAEFVRVLGEVLHRPTIFPLPEWAVKTLLGEMGEELLLTSARVMPAKLNAAGYRFAHSELQDALRAALRS